MASALLASRNELCWGETKVHMRKPPNSSPILKPSTNPNPNLNPRAGGHASDHYPRQIRPPDYDDLAANAAAVSDDSSSFNRKSVRRKESQKDSGGYVTFTISSYSRKELRELKRRLVSELDQVRTLASRIEPRELQSSTRSIGYSTSGVYGGVREVTSSTVMHPNRLQPRDPLVAGSDSLQERPTPRANHHHRPPELLTGKERKSFGGTPSVSPMGPKPLGAAPVVPESEKVLAGMMSKCRQLLAKLMKHKAGVWFNSPVDVISMGLHDYHQIIKRPMDLGTVKSKLTEGLYKSPLEVAADIRLTFNNALLYNPEGHEVHILASQLLRLFEGEFCPAYEKYEKKQAAITREEEEIPRSRTSTCSRAPAPDSVTRPEPVHVVSPRPPAPTPVPIPPPAHAKQHQQQPQPVVGRQLIGAKLPKPKAKDPHKRAMSYEEKGRLSEGLQSLPGEKMAQVLQIVRRRNSDPVQDGDEIELDFEAMDTETLWELDRFVGNCKKMISKIRRQEAMTTNPISTPVPAEVGHNKSPMAGDETADATLVKRIKKGESAIEEDVDIGEELPSANYPPVEIDKDAGYASSSSGSGSDSSSSSGSDSESSSGSDSDDGGAPMRPPPAGREELTTG